MRGVVQGMMGGGWQGKEKTVPPSCEEIVPDLEEQWASRIERWEACEIEAIGPLSISSSKDSQIVSFRVRRKYSRVEARAAPQTPSRVLPLAGRSACGYGPSNPGARKVTDEVSPAEVLDVGAMLIACQLPYRVLEARPRSQL